MTSHCAGSLCRTARAARRIAILLACVGLAAAARADTNTSLGDRTGEGSNPFTGLAKAPEANLFTGALSTSIAIEVPPGRKNATPKLALEYSSSAGPSTFGFGWDLPIGRIEHASKWGVPRCNDPHFNEYVLMMSGTAAELVNDPPGSNTYRPKAEEAYVKAELDTSTNSWVVYDRAGMRYEFGKSSLSRIGTNSSAFSHTEPDGTCTFTSAWALTNMRDPNGNAVDINWFNLLNQLVPLSVEYGGNQTLGTSHLYVIQFSYESRPDTISAYKQGAPIQLVVRLNQITVATYIPAYQSIRSYDLFYDDAQPTRQSLLVAVAKTGLPTQAFTYTPSVTGHRAMCPDPSHCTTFAGPRNFLRAYTDTGDVSNTLMDMNGDGILDFVSWNNAGQTWTVNFGQFGTANGFGFLGATPWRRIFGYGDTIRNVEIDCDAAGGGICTKTDTLDMTGDGIPDFVVGVSPTQWHVYPGRLTDTGWEFAATPETGAILDWATPQRWLRRVTVPLPDNGSTPPENPATGSTVIQDLIDMNGDGLVDLVVTDSSPWLVYLNNGRGFDASPVPYHIPGGGHPPISDSGGAWQRFGLTDFNGDGLPDLLFYNEAQPPNATTGMCKISSAPGTKLHDCFLVAFNNGAGFDEYVVNEVPGGYGFSRDDHKKYYRDLLDINGDGLPDLIERPLVQVGAQWVHTDEWHVQLNTGGKLEPLSYYQNGPYWYAYVPRIWPGLSGPIRERTGNYDITDMVDVDGDGLLDRVATNSSTGWSVWLNRAGASSIDGGGPSQRPNLMTSMSNGFGGTNAIVYRPSTAYDNTGGAGSAPDLPFPVWLVERTCRSDGMCSAGAGDPFDPASNACIAQGHDIATKYPYRDGRFDPPSREFRGFRRVEQITEEAHLDDNQVPVDDVDTTLATEFEQLDTTKGRILAEAWYAGAECVGSQPEPDCRSPEIIRLSANAWSSTPVGNAAAGRSQVWLAQTTIWSFDPFGVNYKLYVDNQPPDAYGNILESTKKDASGTVLVTAHTDYAVPQGGVTSIYNRPSHARTWDPNRLLQEQWFYYDGRQNNTTSDGNVTQVRSRVDPNTSASINSYTTYDGFGNVLAVTDGNGNPTTTSYDAYHLHPVKISNALNQPTDILSRDYRFGAPTEVRDPNGAVHRYSYDVAGRKQCEARPGEDIAVCPISYEYHLLRRRSRCRT